MIDLYPIGRGVDAPVGWSHMELCVSKKKFQKVLHNFIGDERRVYMFSRDSMLVKGRIIIIVGSPLDLPRT
jgi:hypothetical protein